MWTGVLIAMGLVAFFTGMRVAFASVDWLRLEMECKTGTTGKILAYFFRHSDRFISTLMVGNVFTVVVYAALVTRLVETNLLPGMTAPSILLFAEVAVAALALLSFAVFLSQTVFKIYANEMLRLFAGPLLLCYGVLFPLSWLLSGLAYGLLRLVGVQVNKEVKEKAFGKVDLDTFVQSGIENVENEEELDTEVKIFQNVLDFSSIKIRDCIVPRTEVVAVDVSTPLETLKNLFVESGISKIIVYEGNIDHVVGYIHSSEMFRSPADWREHVKQIPIVPETMAAHKLMKLFMQQKKTIAVVVDEFGGVSGIVSLEDLVEEIFGDIEDEHDSTSYVCKQVGEHEYVLSARLEIEKVNETFGLALPESDDYLTIGGLILNSYQSFPKRNEIVAVGPYQFKIVKITSTKIELVRLKVTE